MLLEKKLKPGYCISSVCEFYDMNLDWEYITIAINQALP